MRLLSAALIAALLTPIPAHAEDAGTEEATVTWYDVELIVFRNLETRTSESWPVDAGVPDIENTQPLFPPPELKDEDELAFDETLAQPLGDTTDIGMQADAPAPYVPLGESAQQLANVYASLQRSSRYEPLLHVAWTQPPLEREQAPKLRVTLPDALQPREEAPFDNEPLPGDEETFLADEVDGSATETKALQDDTLPETLLAETQTPLVRPLDGFVQLSVSRYLHLDIDLVYLPDDLNLSVLDDVPAATREWTEEDQREREQRRREILDALARGDISLEEAEILALEPEQHVFQGFRLNQFRRVRSRELHYFDHPAYGVILMVTPREVSARTLDTAH